MISHNLFTDPSFVDAPNGNFALLAWSAAIGMGKELTEVPYDFAGVPRPQGLAYDIGAYEFVVGFRGPPLPPSTVRIAPGN